MMFRLRPSSYTGLCLYPSPQWEGMACGTERQKTVQLAEEEYLCKFRTLTSEVLGKAVIVTEEDSSLLGPEGKASPSKH